MRTSEELQYSTVNNAVIKGLHNVMREVAVPVIWIQFEALEDKNPS